MARDSEFVESYSVKDEFFDVCNSSMQTDYPFVITSTNILLIDKIYSDKSYKNDFACRQEKVACSLVLRATDTVDIRYVSKQTMFDILSRSNVAATDEVVKEESTNRAKQTLAKILRESIQMQASDIHIRAVDKGACYYFRVHGSLTRFFPLNLEMAKEAIGYLINVRVKNDKNLSDESRPTNGTINDYEIKLDDSTVLRELRVSKVPVRGGEKMVIRINDSNANVKSLESFGYDSDVNQFLNRLVKKVDGLIMVTGPTGSGKTNLLAAMTVRVDSTRQKISVEDPVEIRLNNVDQIQITNTGDLRYETILPVVLRQDPDVLMFGEVRTAEVASHLVQFTRTGHLVMTTLHVNSASQGPERLMDLGIKPEEMRSTLCAVIAVRLVQVLCEHCKISLSSNECEITQEQRKDLLRFSSDISSLYIKNPLGCDHCNGIGIAGRQSVIEFIELDDDDFTFIADRTTKKWEQYLKEKKGWKSMSDRAIELVKAGKVDPLEVHHYVPGIEL